MDRCIEHNSTVGFYIDNEWHCLECWKVNQYETPLGKVMDQFSHKIGKDNIVIRVISVETPVRDDLVLLELFINKKLVGYNTDRYLSRANRNAHALAKYIISKKSFIGFCDDGNGTLRFITDSSSREEQLRWYQSNVIFISDDGTHRSSSPYNSSQYYRPNRVTNTSYALDPDQPYEPSSDEESGLERILNRNRRNRDSPSE